MSTQHAVVGPGNSQSQLALWKDKVLPFLMAGGLGIVLLYGAAFAETEALHNAAHDGRHSAGFPCH
ncbi:CbtB domain-containing protein [Janthinobacterium fluminis]|uniref:CbtB-domain containing protein n=1 Tax=Janthinobacterium fluminis TaxID=2987524 RepID=A0ABT5JWF8_9BURK|nr:CbtB domain-containing protein [Janthinobacterium fluminis]MDC8756765.1 CbtB-domain containing protein [Janthinobacterium fluminis]